MEKITRAFNADKQFGNFFLPIMVLLMSLTGLGQTAVTYNLGSTGNFSTPFTSGSSGVYQANSNTELGMYAHGGDNKQCAVWRDFKTAGDNTGAVRALQVGDVFSLQVYASAAYGQIGFSLNTTNATGSWANRIANSRIYIQEDGTNGSWYVNNAAGNLTLDYNVSNTYRNYLFKVYITSETTCDVELIADGVTTKRLFNVTMNGAAGTNITGFSLYLMDDWNGSSNQDVFWKQVTEVRASTSVSLGYYLTTGNYIPGIIKNGFTANTTSTPSVNKVNVGGDPGSTVILNKVNTYTGATTVNALARMELQNAQGAGATSGITVQNTAALSLYSATGIAFNNYPLTLNGAGQNGANGALRNVGGNNIWPGSITLASASAINNDISGSLTLSGGVSMGTNALSINAAFPITVSGLLNGSGTLTKTGTALLTMSQPAFTGGFQLNAGTALFDLSSDASIPGIISGAGQLTKAGTATLTLSAANTYTGTTTVSSGILTIDAAERISNTSNMVLNGGTFSTGGAAGFSETVGTLNLTASSTIALGTGNHTLAFANSGSIAWTGSTLTITGWNGIAGQSNTNGGKIIFTGSFGTGLGSEKLPKIVFAGYTGVPTILPSGEVIPQGPVFRMIELPGSSMNHGTVCLGSAGQIMNYRITNIGAAATGVVVFSSNPEFVITNAPTSLAFGETADITVTFMPTVAGTRANLLQINSSTPNTQLYGDIMSGIGKALPTASVTGDTSLCINSPQPAITFTGAGGTAPYTFTYNINGGGNITVTTTSGSSVTVNVPTDTLGSYAYNLVSIQESSATACSNLQSGTATVNIIPPTIYYADMDGDGYGDELYPLQSCTGAPVQGGHVAVLNSTDCNDGDVFIYQTGTLYIDNDNDGWDAGQTEVCYGTDALEGYSLTTSGTDCDDTDSQKRSNYTFYTDADGDTYGAGSAMSVCALNATTAPAGLSVNNTDCDDSDTNIFQSTLLYTDADGDGYDNGSSYACYGPVIPEGKSLTTLGTDCNDNDAQAFHLTTVYVDTDGDGYDAGQSITCHGATLPAGVSLTTLGFDCNDSNPAIYKYETYYVDNDGDGYGAEGSDPLIGVFNLRASVCSGVGAPQGYAATILGTDCNDSDATVYRYGLFYVDNDGDGYTYSTQNESSYCYGATAPEGKSATTLGVDCDDNNPAIYQNAYYYIDEDGDGYSRFTWKYDQYTVGNATPVMVCSGNTVPVGYSSTSFGLDCDDHNPGITAIFLVNYVDNDGDGYGISNFYCAGGDPDHPAGSYSNDCNDNDASVYHFGILYRDDDNDGYINSDGSSSNLITCYGATIPAGFTFVYDGLDCDDSNTNHYQIFDYYIDVDGDGYDDGQEQICYGLTGVPPGHSLTTLGHDCNDNDASVHRSEMLYADADADGYDAGQNFVCFGAEIPAGWAFTTNGNDCDDTNAAVFQSVTYYIDADDDGYDSGTAYLCAGATPPAGYKVTTLGSDCDDTNPAVYQVGTYYIDADGDNYTAGIEYLCAGATVPPGYTTTTLGNDCDETDTTKFQYVNYYVDADADGYNNGSATLCSGNTVPTGYSTTTSGFDCNDQDALVFQNNSYFIDADGDGYDAGTVWLCSGNAVPTGYALVTSGSDCNDNDNTLTTNCATSSIVNLKLFIEGYFIGAGRMNSVKYNQDYESDTNKVEELTIELHDAITYERVASTNAMLYVDGSMHCVFPNLPNGSYYIVVKGSNIIQTWSAEPQAFSSSEPLAYDFTTSASKAYGDNLVENTEQMFMIYSGDLNHDDIIDPTDYAQWELDFNNFSFGVFATDLNGDGIVDPSDYAIWELNFNKFIFANYPF